MKRRRLEVCQADSRLGPVWLRCLVVLFLFTSVGVGQKSRPNGTSDSLLGIHIGTTLGEVRAKLTPIATGGGRDTNDGGRKEAWTLKETDYATLAFRTDSKGKVAWVSAFVRPEREIPFSTLGDLSRATDVTDSQAIWNVRTPMGGYRLVVKGAHRKAQVIYLLSLAFPEIQ